MERITSGGHRGLPAIVYDRVNDDETEAGYMASLKAAVSRLGTRRFLIMPQVSQVTEPEGVTAKLRKIDQAINGLWPGNRFSPPETIAFQRALSDPSTRADGLHRNAKGQAIEAAFIKRWLDQRGWRVLVPPRAGL